MLPMDVPEEEFRRLVSFVDRLPHGDSEKLRLYARALRANVR